MKEILKFQKEIYENNAAKGFWEKGKDRNKGEAVMLFITELSESVEAHRKDRRVNMSAFEGSINNYTIEYPANTDHSLRWKNTFEMYVKDTLEDELADTVIRIIDYCYGFGIELLDTTYIEETTGNYSEDVLTICAGIITAYAEQLTPESSPNKSYYNWSDVLGHIVAFCKWYNIDLVKHIELKLRYNLSRPPKHGKKY